MEAISLVNSGCRNSVCLAWSLQNISVTEKKKYIETVLNYERLKDLTTNTVGTLKLEFCSGK